MIEPVSISDLYTFDGILEEGLRLNAGDINITSGHPLSYRVKKEIIKYETVIISDMLILTAIKILTESTSKHIDIYSGEEFDGSYIYKDRYFYRYNISLSNSRIHISLRKLLDDVPSFEAMQLNRKEVKPFIESIVKLTHGIHLVTGPTGSGKSSTLVTILDKALKENSVKMVTLEDPIEYYFKISDYPKSEIIQREIGRDTKSFYLGLRAAMRQNPDIIFVGEIRDEDTAQTAVQAAYSGHCILGTLHASSVEDTKERLMGLLKNSPITKFDFLKGIINQRLGYYIEDGVKKFGAIREVWTP